MVGRGAPEPKRSWRAGKTLLARQAHRSENPPASAVGSVNCSINLTFRQTLQQYPSPLASYQVSVHIPVQLSVRSNAPTLSARYG